MTQYRQNTPGMWNGPQDSATPGPDALYASLLSVKKPVFAVQKDGKAAYANAGTACLGDTLPDRGLPLIAAAPALSPEDLGDPAFKNAHGLKYAYVAGAMANGITSVEMVCAMAKSGMLGFFGSAGLPIPRVADAVARMQAELPGLPFGCNLIHSPYEPRLEEAIVRLYLEQGVNLISASAFMDMTLPLVWYRASGLSRGPDGRIVRARKVVGKVSRVEVAEKFLSPAPAKILSALRERNLITETQATLAAKVPMADDITAEADSGGHTDNRPAITLLPTMLALAEECKRRFGYDDPPRVGLAGGIATPHSTAAAFAMGAAYVLTGSVNQACVEAGTSAAVREMLAQARQADVIMAPSADMFELGVKVQVLKRGTMFPLRAAKLYDLYAHFQRFEDIPEKQRGILERDFFKGTFDDTWESTRRFFEERDPSQIPRAEADPRHKMALVFRSYLGQSSGWATTGVPDRKIDYQIWCGPSMGAFNQWVKGTFLEEMKNRNVTAVAMNLLLGACYMHRAKALQYQGALPEGAPAFTPLTMEQIRGVLSETPETAFSPIGRAAGEAI